MCESAPASAKVCTCFEDVLWAKESPAGAGLSKSGLDLLAGYRNKIAAIMIGIKSSTSY
jgi:hypothetical protein